MRRIHCTLVAWLVAFGTVGCTASFSELCGESQTCQGDAGPSDAPLGERSTSGESDALGSSTDTGSEASLGEEWPGSGSDAGLDADSAGESPDATVTPESCSEGGCVAAVAAREGRAASSFDAMASDSLEAGSEAASADGMADAAPETFVCDVTRDPKDEPCVLDDAYGVFVASPDAVDGSAGASGRPASLVGDGSMARPYEQIGQALANLGAKARVYVCNGLYREALGIQAPVHIYGGLACSEGPAGRVWSYVGGTARVESASAASVKGVTSGTVTIEDVSITSGTRTTSGASVIAVFIVSSSVRFVRATLTAKDGANGSNGTKGADSPNYVTPAPTGGPPLFDRSNGLFVPVSGGMGGTNTCLLFGSSSGGAGALSCTETGKSGSAMPPAPVLLAGRDGMSRTSTSPEGRTTALDDPGADGQPGLAPVAKPSHATLTSDGLVVSAGADGAIGNPAQGGAGGSDPIYGACGAPVVSLGGGGGGAGGCGGSGGQGGQAGGWSVTLASVGASAIDLQESVLVAGAGGLGGQGGSGQDGQAGGVGGFATELNTVSGPGAPGGNGAGGGGGSGGPGGGSVAVLYQSGVRVTYDTATMQNIKLGPPGVGGSGGPLGTHPVAAVLPTGSDGHPGPSGPPGVATAFLVMM